MYLFIGLLVAIRGCMIKSKIPLGGRLFLALTIMFLRPVWLGGIIAESIDKELKK